MMVFFVRKLIDVVYKYRRFTFPYPMPDIRNDAFCYGRSTVVSDLDGWGFVLNV
jgi:hypothetical protein